MVPGPGHTTARVSGSDRLIPRRIYDPGNPGFRRKIRRPVWPGPQTTCILARNPERNSFVQTTPHSEALCWQLVIFFKMAFPPGEGGHGGEQRGPEKCMTEFQKSCVTSRLPIMSRLKKVFNCRTTTVLTVFTETGTPVKSGGPFLPPRQLAIFRDFPTGFGACFTELCENRGSTLSQDRYHDSP